MTAAGEITKRKRGAQSGTPLLVRLQPDDLELLDIWIDAHGGMSRPEAYAAHSADDRHSDANVSKPETARIKRTLL